MAKELPILFQGWGVRAILDGRKTQTRRVIKPQPEHPLEYRTDGQGVGFSAWVDPYLNEDEGRYHRCPYAIGDVLWVRERFRASRPFTGDLDHDFTTEQIHYYADDHPKYRDQDKWKPSIHMPKWACRLWLRVKDVRAERVQEISEGDAKAEGAPSLPMRSPIGSGIIGPNDYRGGFLNVWDQINAKRGYGWDVNPWVWVVEFERIEHGS